MRCYRFDVNRGDWVYDPTPGKLISSDREEMWRSVVGQCDGR